jgi:hypothetical protein
VAAIRGASIDIACQPTQPTKHSQGNAIRQVHRQRGYPQEVCRIRPIPLAIMAADKIAPALPVTIQGRSIDSA